MRHKKKRARVGSIYISERSLRILTVVGIRNYKGKMCCDLAFSDGARGEWIFDNGYPEHYFRIYNTKSRHAV